MLYNTSITSLCQKFAYHGETTLSSKVHAVVSICIDGSAVRTVRSKRLKKQP